ncbi:MAG: hypothetical protein AB8I08_31975 [Sandaracinaceae bacterium]
MSTVPTAPLPGSRASAPPLLAVLTAPVRALDRVRWLWLKALGPFAKPLVRNRELRVAAAGSTLILLSMLGTALAPMWMLALGPVLWGVPHVVGDVRYLAVRPGRHRMPRFWLLVALPLLVLSFTGQPVWGFVAALGAVFAARGPWYRRVVVAAPLAALAYLAVDEVYMTAVVFAHAHNFIAVGLFWSWRKRAGRLHWIPLALFFGGAAFILAGGLDALALDRGSLSWAPPGLEAGYHMMALAPEAAFVWAVRLVLLFAFAQSVHYVVWVRLVAEEDRPRETPRTFHASLVALREDFGGPLLGLTILATVGLFVWAAFDVFAARDGYLRAILFHGHFEVAIAAWVAIEGVRPGRRTAT